MVGECLKGEKSQGQKGGERENKRGEDDEAAKGG